LRGLPSVDLRRVTFRLVRSPRVEENHLRIQPSVEASIPLYLLTLGLYELWRRAISYEVTEDAVVFRKGIVNKDERVVPLTEIQDVKLQLKIGFALVELATAGGGGIRGALTRGRIQTLPLTRDDARAFYEAIRTAMRTSRGSAEAVEAAGLEE
jgi:membrane protein YdbS with pleckstrin-like domain